MILVPETVHVVMAADSRFVWPMTVAVRSMIDTLSPNSQLHLHVLDAGLTPVEFAKATMAWHPDDYDSLQCHLTLYSVGDIDQRILDAPACYCHSGRTSYYRLLLAKCLPQDLHRVIYLDGDVLVREDLTKLWREPLRKDAIVAATQDAGAPYICTRVGRPGAQAYHDVAIGNWQSLKLNPTREYFNAGVMLIDLDAWRQADMQERCLQVLADNAGRVQWCDQYALNVALHQNFQLLDLEWNQGSHIFSYGPTWTSTNPFNEGEFRECCDNPKIVHYTCNDKPWNKDSTHPWRQQWRAMADRTTQVFDACFARNAAEIIP